MVVYYLNRKSIFKCVLIFIIVAVCIVCHELLKKLRAALVKRVELKKKCLVV